MRGVRRDFRWRGCVRPVVLLFLGILALRGAGLVADEKDWFVPLGPPPEAAPRRISGGEGVPPLPLPATPLRRSERKRDPSPPRFIAKVIWGESATFTYDSGASASISDWNLCPADLQQLLRRADEALGVRLGSDRLALADFDGDPAKTPVLFFSGVRRIKFDPSTLDQLRAYVLRGGMIVADNIAGSPYFYAAFREAMATAFPELRWHTLPLDHPLFHMVSDAREVAYPRNLTSREPLLEGMYVYARIGVLLSKYGLGCGWDGHEVPLLPQAIYYDVPSASKLGVNLVAYILGYARLARESARPELLLARESRRATDAFVFAQLRHEGAWNAHAGGIPALLERLSRQTALRVNPQRVSVTPGSGDLSAYSFLYLTGLDDFQWDAAAQAALRRFLEAGGTLFVNNGLGLQTFDRAFRREIKRLLPDLSLQPVPAEHPLFRAVVPVERMTYSPAVQALRPQLDTPQLEGVTLRGDLKVIYSPYDLEAGWEGLEPPLARSCATEPALNLGLNIVFYAMTH